MTSTMTVDEAREQLRQAEAHYLAVESEGNRMTEGQSTPERVLRQVELAAALQEAAQALIEAKATFTEIDERAKENRRQRARNEMPDVEEELVTAIDQAESDMAALEATLATLLGLAKKRYALMAEASGRSQPRLLARSGVAGWIQFRLGGGLELGDLGTAPHRYRLPLAEILGLPGVDTDQQEEEQ